MTSFRAYIYLNIFWCCLVWPLQAQEVTVVLSSDLPPYLEAYEAFRTAYGKPVHRIDLKDDLKDIPETTRIVIALGGKAALQTYNKNLIVIYGLAPGVDLGEKVNGQSVIKVAMVPSAPELIKRLKRVQPTLRRLGIFWSTNAQKSYLNDLESACRQWDVEIISEQAVQTDDLPDGLRWMLRRGIDGIWLPPDPVLINPRSFGLFREFSRSNDIPLYVPSNGLLNKGAVASISCSFDEVGRKAGEVARRILNGETIDEVVYPEKIVLWINRLAADQAGLKIDHAAITEMGGEIK